ncbi:MAG: hypothetical protein AB7V50_06250 [Vampirovibrionia bacterium]
MKKYIFGLAMVALIMTPAAIADDDYDAIACNHKTGKCYEAEVDINGGFVTIEFEDKKGNDYEVKLKLDDYDDSDMTAYYPKEGAYYDIEITDDD